MCKSMTFMCDKSADYSDSLAQFNTCLTATDCYMHDQMRVTPHFNNKITTFMHQMIPHHENAVNMAKTLLKDPVAAADGDIKTLLMDVINTQNFQIHFMVQWLKDNDSP